MALNADWHRAHPMPPRATFQQRVDWHREHAQVCGCRTPPPDIAAVLESERAADPDPDRDPASGPEPGSG